MGDAFVSDEPSVVRRVVGVAGVLVVAVALAIGAVAVATASDGVRAEDYDAGNRAVLGMALVAALVAFAVIALVAYGVSRFMDLTVGRSMLVSTAAVATAGLLLVAGGVAELRCRGRRRSGRGR